MAATAELQTPYSLDTAENFTRIIEQEFAVPLIIPLAEAEADADIREQAARFIGAVAIGEGESHEDPASSYSLFDALNDAYDGDETAERMVYTNALTDIIERSIKSGFVMQIEWQASPDGIRQDRQTDADIQANSLRHGSPNPKMRPRYEAEVRNMFRQREAYRHGKLEDYALLVPSRAADDMSKDEMAKEGFFTETMSTALQLTTVKDGVLTTESAFVAGVARPGGQRHDGAALRLLGERLEVDWSGTAATTLDRSVLIHKDLIPNGVIDVVEMLDRCTSEVVGEEVFFGEAKPTQDYAIYREECREREANFAGLAVAIKDELIDAAPDLQGPTAASQALSALSAKHAISHAIKDETIDARVFGAEAADAIELGRYYFAIQDYENMERQQNAAIKVETSSSCPGGVRAGGDGQKESGESSDDAGSDERGSLQFECPKCKRTNTRPRGKLISNCRHCGADVRC